MTMATFPRLKTNAVMQYPAACDLRYDNAVFRFLDGSEQCYRLGIDLLRKWPIRLDLLDESEVARLQEFFRTNQGRFGNFSFVDPWDGREYPNCSLDQDSFEFELLSEMRLRTVLVVKQNRS
jgi:hypothetical protein